MYDSATQPTDSRPTPTLGLRIRVMERRYRFASLLSRLSGRSLEEAWRIFQPLPGPEGSWGVPMLGAAGPD